MTTVKPQHGKSTSEQSAEREDAGRTLARYAATLAFEALPPAVVLLTVSVTVIRADCDPLAIINTCPV